MQQLSKALVLAATLLIAIHPIFAAEESTQKSPPLKEAPSAPVVDNHDVLLKAMHDELDRSIKHLRIEKKAPPYFIGYRATDDQRVRLTYELGKKAEDDAKHERIVQIDMHAGNHQFDNSADLTRTSGRNASRYVALDDNYDAIRRNLWVLTDDAYKQASEDYEKQEAYKHGHIIRNLTDSFTKSTPIVQHDPRKPELNLKENWDERLRKLSLVFSKYPEIRKSWVVMEADAQTFRIANTEGTSIRFPWTPIVIGITAFARCPDGEDIWDCDYVRVINEKDVPSQEELEARANALAENLVAYTKAERKNYYFGPVLFEQQAAAELLQHGIAPKLVAMPGDNLRPSGTLLRCVNTRIMPKFLSISDEPERTSYANQTIAGPYQFDDEGTPCKKVNIVDKGFLKELLSGRTPVLPEQKSNGHNFGESIIPTTLVMESDKPVPTKSLENELLHLAKEQGLKEAVLVKRIVPQTGRIMHGDTETARSDSLDRCQPLEVYSINLATGARKRIRGLRFHGFDLGTMQGIVAAGNDTKAYNSVNWIGSVRTVVAPSLLVNHLEMEEDGRDTLAPYPLENPYFAAK